MASELQKLLDQQAKDNRERYRQEIRQVFISVFGYDPGPGVFGADDAIHRPNVGMGQRVRDIYSRIHGRKGGTSLELDDPDLIDTTVAETGLTPDQARALYQQGHRYFQANQNVMPDEAIEQSISQSLPFGRNPTLEAQTFQEGQRQFDANQQNALVRAMIDALSRGGPADYYQFDKMVGQGRDYLSTLQSNQARQQGFSGRPVRQSAQNILDRIFGKKQAAGVM